MNGGVVQAMSDPQWRVEVAGEVEAPPVPVLGLVGALRRRRQHSEEAIGRAQACRAGTIPISRAMATVSARPARYTRGSSGREKG